MDPKTLQKARTRTSFLRNQAPACTGMGEDEGLELLVLFVSPWPLLQAGMLAVAAWGPTHG